MAWSFGQIFKMCPLAVILEIRPILQADGAVRKRICRVHSDGRFEEATFNELEDGLNSYNKTCADETGHWRRILQQKPLLRNSFHQMRGCLIRLWRSILSRMSASETFEKPHEKERAAMPDNLESAIRLLSWSIQCHITESKAQFEWFRSHLDCVTKRDLELTEGRIMSAIADYAAKQKAFNDRQAAAIDGLGTSITGIQGDIKGLNDLIEKLQTSGGTISAEDQATLDALETAGDATATRRGSEIHRRCHAALR